ncbi:MAG: hypothetical protein IKE34_08115 [Paenibacillus sp.]|uniref:Uncharacterized protein n=1 Tax=Paenibacillus aquistagni TaxID=1852522 RepID=A0A1X7L457_9BACL|nr:hypothetical protein [Paenibacillus aquistagni]MBR2569138.1 hypothetical protein [Paenibacillus sp.]NMM54618.1 hypothetical protein [Paenibacillus aquistagni]SMG48668.1 hypothetical protein SAMN06295960_2974 [Paenibacillus aquistagni]
MARIREHIPQDYVIEQVKEAFQCTVLWCEGRACLEYDSQEQLEHITSYVKETFDRDILDVFFTAIESIPPE